MESVRLRANWELFPLSYSEPCCNPMFFFFLLDQLEIDFTLLLLVIIPYFMRGALNCPKSFLWNRDEEYVDC